MQLSGHRWALKGLLFEMQKKIYNLMVIRRPQKGYLLRLKIKMCNIKVSKRALNGLLYASVYIFFMLPDGRFDLILYSKIWWLQISLLNIILILTVKISIFDAKF